MDKLDICLIPFIYLLITTLIIFPAFTSIVHTPSIIGRGIKDTLTWMATAGIHLVQLMLSILHIMIQFKVIQVPLNMILQLPLYCAILFWSKFYYRLFKYKEVKSSFWITVTNWLGAEYRRPVRQSNQITCLNVRYYCHSYYQAKGAYDHLH